jgi:hypothetical protein
MNKSIVLDLDGVISNITNSIDNWLLKNKNIQKGEFNYSDWIITDSKDDRAMDVFNDNLFWKNMIPYEDSWHQINYWFNSGIDVHIVTARRCPAAIEETHAWLDFWRINTTTPYFANINEKHTVISELNPKFVVEDNPHEVKILIDKGINAFLRKQWYNKEYWHEVPTIETLYELDWK